MLSPEETHQMAFVPGVPALCHRGRHRILLEPPFRSRWPQTRSVVLPRRYDRFDHLVRALPVFLDDRLQVRPTPRLRCAIHSLCAPLSRCLHGALKGSLGVTKSAMVELTDESNVARGFALLQMAWSVGYVIGSGASTLVPPFSLRRQVL
jgi:hypothetical protein